MKTKYDAKITCVQLVNENPDWMEATFEDFSKTVKLPYSGTKFAGMWLVYIDLNSSECMGLMVKLNDKFYIVIKPEYVSITPVNNVGETNQDWDTTFFNVTLPAVDDKRIFDLKIGMISSLDGMSLDVGQLEFVSLSYDVLMTVDEYNCCLIVSPETQTPVFIRIDIFNLIDPNKDYRISVKSFSEGMLIILVNGYTFANDETIVAFSLVYDVSRQKTLVDLGVM